MKDSVKKWILLGGLAAVVVVFLVVKSLSGVEDFLAPWPRVRRLPGPTLELEGLEGVLVPAYRPGA